MFSNRHVKLQMLSCFYVLFPNFLTISNSLFWVLLKLSRFFVLLFLVYLSYNCLTEMISYILIRLLNWAPPQLDDQTHGMQKNKRKRRRLQLYLYVMKTGIYIFGLDSDFNEDIETLPRPISRLISSGFCLFHVIEFLGIIRLCISLSG